MKSNFKAIQRQWTQGRSKEEQERYNLIIEKSKTCPFCNLEAPDGNAILQDYVDESEASNGMYVLRNLFPYERWDSREVKSHLLLVPSRHILKFEEFTPRETVAYYNLIRKFDAKGYSSLTRAVSNPGKSVEHFHTHLIVV